MTYPHINVTICSRLDGIVLRLAGYQAGLVILTLYRCLVTTQMINCLLEKGLFTLFDRYINITVNVFYSVRTFWEIIRNIRLMILQVRT